MSTWQPIETAPRDKTILVYGAWAGEINGPQAHHAAYVAHFTGHGDYAEYDWRCEGTDAYAAWCKPTHWMPLPDPPEAA